MKTFTPAEIETLAAAMKILEERALYIGAQFEANSPKAVKDYCRFWLLTEEREIFCCIWLDSQNRVLEKEELFAGTLSQTSVYPREVVKTALAHNAASVILVHNHPSGICEASQADRNLTNHLKRALELVDVRVLDHMIVGCGEVYSFAEKGLI